VGMGATTSTRSLDTDVLRLLVQRAFHIHGLEERKPHAVQRRG